MVATALTMQSRRLRAASASRSLMERTIASSEQVGARLLGACCPLAAFPAHVATAVLVCRDECGAAGTVELKIVPKDGRAWCSCEGAPTTPAPCGP